MTDNATHHNKDPWLPGETWANAASFLDNVDFARFRQLCKFAQSIGSQATILQPLYNRLYALDETLPTRLPQEDTLIAFKQAFEKIQARQQFEMAYLTKHHPVMMKKPEYIQVFQENTTESLQALEAKNATLDEINSEIIRAKINLNKPRLNLMNAHITRLPVALFQEPAYVNFWKNLIHLSCSQNKLTTLNVQKLTKLQQLWCSKNQLSTLKVQGLMALGWLSCHNNKLTNLNVQGLVALQWLACDNNQLTILNVQGLATLQRLECESNPLKTLILTGVHANTKNKYAELEKKLLFNKLSQSESSTARQAIIRRLSTDYTYQNCLKYCPIYAAKLFAFDSANSAYHFTSSALSQVSAFLPSFSFGMANHSTENTSLKRKRNEEEVCIESPSDESDNQPDTKKRKRK